MTSPYLERPLRDLCLACARPMPAGATSCSCQLEPCVVAPERRCDCRARGVGCASLEMT